MKIALREIPFGPCGDADEVCIYATGKIEDREQFLAAVRAFGESDVPQDARDALGADDVQYLRFRPMSPSEARGYGYTSGVMQCGEHQGCPVTAVKL